jgi:hypothetical protein
MNKQNRSAPLIALKQLVFPNICSGNLPWVVCCYSTMNNVYLFLPIVLCSVESNTHHRCDVFREKIDGPLCSTNIKGYVKSTAN